MVEYKSVKEIIKIFEKVKKYLKKLLTKEERYGRI